MPPSILPKDTTLTELIATEPGRELHERIVKIGTWDGSENIPEIEAGRELIPLRESCRLAFGIVAGKRRRHPLSLEDMDFA